MKGNIQALIVDNKTSLIPLNFFNAIESPFTRGLPRQEKHKGKEITQGTIDCSVLKDRKITACIWYKNITPVHYEDF